MASALVLSGKPGLWSGQYPGTQPPYDDCPQEVLHIDDNDRSFFFFLFFSDLSVNVQVNISFSRPDLLSQCVPRYS